jgi:large subunit ribosomal protein L3
MENQAMSKGMVGRKCGMTRIFQPNGESVPVTVLDLSPNRITQLKTIASDGYNAVQVTCGSRRTNRVSKARQGHFAKANTEAGRGLWEFRLTEDEMQGLELGADLNVNMFAEGQKIDVTGTSKGKGFAGAIKRHNFHTQDMTHGNSLAHRSAGSIGQNQTPGRVFKGKKMAGHMGNEQVTIQTLEVVRIDAERNLLMVKGAVPGAIDGDVIVHPAMKVKNK